MTVRRAKSEITRERIIDATVECIAKLGYGGATTDVIARAAGTTRGPLQYYFRTRAGLIQAAFERLHRHIMALYSERLRETSNARAYVEALLDASYAICRSPEHYALLEILIAARSDPELQAALSPLLDRTNEEIDRTWISHFPEKASDPQQLIAARYLLVAMTRGLALNSLTFPDDALFEREFALKRQIALNLFGLS